jgi:ubiquinone/menaquinone biosynthesis C-methylase UbiE
MNLYSRFLLPQLLDWTMAGDEFSQCRRQVLANVQGEILEIGFGTGLNLPHYPNHVRKLTAIDVNPGMNAIAQKRMKNTNITVDYQVLNGERLPMPDATFDSVVSTWTLCSINNVEQALREIYRVLKPKGRFFFVEHGLSNDPKVQVWQHRLTPIQKVIGDGCRLDRDIQALIQKSFQTLEVKQFQMPDFPAIAGYFYLGTATKTPESILREH